MKLYIIFIKHNSVVKYSVHFISGSVTIAFGFVVLHWFSDRHSKPERDLQEECVIGEEASSES